jgi:hypothetical protein
MNHIDEFVDTSMDDHNKLFQECSEQGDRETHNLSLFAPPPCCLFFGVV